MISHSPDETEKIAEELAKTLHPGDVIALRGDLGAGKTTFVRGLAKGLGVTSRVQSPTYALVNEYGDKLFHFDWYRIASEDELYDLGWDNYLERGGICAVEWSERAPGMLPPNTVVVTLSPVSEEERSISIENLSS